MSDLYDTDILLWSEQQSALLRGVASGENVAELVFDEDGIDACTVDDDDPPR